MSAHKTPITRQPTGRLTCIGKASQGFRLCMRDSLRAENCRVGFAHEKSTQRRLVECELQRMHQLTCRRVRCTAKSHRAIDRTELQSPRSGKSEMFTDLGACAASWRNGQENETLTPLNIPHFAYMSTSSRCRKLLDVYCDFCRNCLRLLAMLEFDRRVR
jgi:hypothetical protein